MGAFLNLQDPYSSANEFFQEQLKQSNASVFKETTWWDISARFHNLLKCWLNSFKALKKYGLC